MKKIDSYKITLGIILSMMLTIMTLVPCEQSMAKPITFKLVTGHPSSSELMRSTYQLGEMVAEMSNGELKIEVLGGPEVIPISDQGTAVKNGVIDIIDSFTAGWGSLVPIGSALSLSRLSATEERKIGFIDFIAEQVAKANLYYLGRSLIVAKPGVLQFFVKKKIDRPQQLEGLKIACPDPLMTATLKKIKAVAVSVPYAEMYTAVETGVVDGYRGSMGSLAGTGIQDLSAYWLEDLALLNYTSSYIMNKDSFYGLPKHLQEILVQAQLKRERGPAQKIMADIDSTDRASLLAPRKIELVTFSPNDTKWFFETAYNAEWEVLIKRYPVLGPQARKFLEKN
jgi:TRAP-type C4-dicarboxylate transport system substrate-binding protein